jgi:hypothetical protein
MTTREDLRSAAVISNVFIGQEDHGIWTVVIYLQGPTGGWGQGFGSLCLENEAGANLFLAEVCATFDAATSEALKGMPCTALYAKPLDKIEGLEAASGKRFTIRGYRMRHHPDKAPTPTEAERGRLERDIAWHRRVLAERTAELQALGELIDWETAP